MSLQVADVVANAENAWPVRVSWRDRDRAHEVSQVHRLLAADPHLGWAILRGLRYREQHSVCSEVWVGARRYKAGEWAKLGHMGYIGAEDEGIWGTMVGGDWEGEEAVKEEPPPPPKSQTTTPETPSHQNL